MFGRHFEFQKNEEVLSISVLNKIITLELGTGRLSLFLRKKGNIFFLSLFCSA